MSEYDKAVARYNRTMSRLAIAYPAMLIVGGVTVLAALFICVALFGMGLIAAVAWLGSTVFITRVTIALATRWIHS